MRRSELFDMLENAGDATFVVEPDGGICFWSRTAERLLGYRRDEVIAKPCGEVIVGVDEAGCEVCKEDCNVLELSRRMTPIPAYDLHAMTASGERRWVSVSVLAAPVRPGPSPLAVHLVRDIERRKQVADLAREIVRRVGEVTDGERNAGAEPAPSPSIELTSKERTVLIHLSKGRGTKEIATELNISPATTRNHIQRILKKLQCHGRLEAVMRATREGLI